VGVAGYIVLIVYNIGFAVRRINDTNQNGWLVVLLIIPLVNFFMTLYLVFAPGTPGPNNYGAPPPPNGGGVVAAALIMPLVMTIGILAAIAIPAYQQYTARAAAHADTMQTP